MMKTILFEQASNTYYQLSSSGVSKVDDEAESGERNLLIIDSACSIVSVDMPLKQEKQIIKALPFALEEAIGSELEQTHISFLAKKDNKAYSMVVAKQFMNNLFEDNRNAAVFYLPTLLPCKDNTLTIAVINDTACIKASDVEAYSVPLMLLEKALTAQMHSSEIGTIELYIAQSDTTKDNNLLKAQLDSFGVEVIEGQLNTLVPDLMAPPTKNKNLFGGEYKRVKQSNKFKATKFRPVMYASVALLILALSIINIQTTQLSGQAAAVKLASVEFYKKLFPGERVRPRLMKKQLNDLINENNGNHANDTGFTTLLASTAGEVRSLKSISFESIKFNQKNGVLEASLICKTVNQLDQLKNALAKKGLSVDIASANQSGNSVKGVIKVSSNG